MVYILDRKNINSDVESDPKIEMILSYGQIPLSFPRGMDQLGGKCSSERVTKKNVLQRGIVCSKESKSVCCAAMVMARYSDGSVTNASRTVF